MSEILIVDDERSMREFLEIFCQQDGWSTRSASGVKEALKLFDDKEPKLVITDLKMKGPGGLELLKAIKKRNPAVEVIVVTAFATDATAMEAIKLGAYDYIQKPFQVEEIRVVMQRALERQRLLRENVTMRVELTGRYDFFGMVGRSPRMQEVYRLIEQVAPSKSTVVISGESGTGKELVARAIHFRSTRNKAPFVPIDCSSIPETLLESELFGHQRGAFTGATADRKGLFELAEGGTVFLDEIAEVPAPVQVKLLRVLQERKVRRLGEGKDRPVDVRLVAATNRDLESEVAEGRFREDLFYRLNVIRIHLPALRERLDDVPDLVRHFVAKLCAEAEDPPSMVLDEALDALRAYDFPGNVRELENLVERAVALGGHRPLGAELFVDHLKRRSAEVDLGDLVLPEEGIELDSILAGVERKLINQALVLSGGTKKDAAKLLGISFRSIRYRVLKLGME